MSIWLLLTSSILFFFWNKHDHLAQNGIVTVAKVTELHPELHDTLNYKYAVGDKVYQGVATRNDLRVRVGSEMKIYYDSTNPSISCIPNPKLTAEHTKVIFFGFIGICVLVVLLLLSGFGIKIIPK